MIDNLDGDLDALDEAVTRLVAVALECVESAEVAMFALISAAERLHSESDAPPDLMEEIVRLVHRR